MNPAYRIFRSVAACRSIRCWLILLLLAGLFPPSMAHNGPGRPGKVDPVSNNPSGAGSADIIDLEPEPSPFDETSVFVSVQRIGGQELPVIIRDRTVFLPVEGLFGFLKIKARPSPRHDSVSGHFIDESKPYLIDGQNYRISYGGKVFQIGEPELIRSPGGLYLREDQFGAIFGLICVFDYRNLTVRISAGYELPAAREMQQELMRRNAGRLRGDVKADTAIGRSRTLAHFGTLDWMFNATQVSNGLKDYRLGIGLGGTIAGGQATVILNINNREQLNQRQQFYQWHYANNDHKGLRQLSLGRIFPQAVSSIFDPVVGVQVSNTPTSYRRSFGSYRLSRSTQPGWTVELLVNNVLVDYIKADASGFFAFDVPLVYGKSQVKLRYYGLYGEERSSEETITIPFNFLPKGEYEYIASAGMVLDTLSSRFARGGVNYGLTSRLTVGAGTEYLSSVRNRPTMPFVNASLRVTPDLMLTADYTKGVRGRTILTYRMPYNAQLELNYTRFARDQRAIVFNNIEERRASLSVPYRTRSFFGLTRVMFTQYLITDYTKYTTAEWLVSANLRALSANVNTYFIQMNQGDPPRSHPYFYSNFSLSYRFPKGYTLTPEAQYSFTERHLISMRCELEKFILGRGFLNISYERNFRSNSYSIGAGLRYDLSFGRAGAAFRQYNNVRTITQSAAGSMIFDGKTRLATGTLRTAVGRGGITLRPFLDLNGNGVYDAGEPLVNGLRARVSSGRVAYAPKDTLVRVFELEPWINAFIDISQNNFENAGWTVRYKTLNVLVEPNNMKLIDVPVDVRSEASGTVRINGPDGSVTEGRIRLCSTRPDGSVAGCATTDADGYYNITGMTPGHYTVQPDQAQLEVLGVKSYPANIELDVRAKIDGDIVDRLDFVLR